MNDKLEYIYQKYPNAKCELNYGNIFQLLIAVSLSAQTTDAKVNKVTETLFASYPDAQSLSKADIEDIKEILKPLGMYNSKANNILNVARIIHNDFNDEVPTDRDKLLTLPGVGNKTINVLYAEGFKIPAFPVDTHVNRICKRLQFANKDDSVEVVEEKMKKIIPEDKWIQMHHSIIFFGRYFCKAIKPNCDECELRNCCKKDNY